MATDSVTSGGIGHRSREEIMFASQFHGITRVSRWAVGSFKQLGLQLCVLSIPPTTQSLTLDHTSYTIFPSPKANPPKVNPQYRTCNDNHQGPEPVLSIVSPLVDWSIHKALYYRVSEWEESFTIDLPISLSLEGRTLLKARLLSFDLHHWLPLSNPGALRLLSPVPCWWASAAIVEIHIAYLLER